MAKALKRGIHQLSFPPSNHFTRRHPSSSPHHHYHRSTTSLTPLPSLPPPQELQALIKYIEINKASDLDWFTIKPTNKEGTHWEGLCWYIHELIKYEFKFQFDIPATYPTTAPEIEIPELEGKTAKMYRGGKICLTIHFKPLWAKNSPHFGVAHALCLGLAPWLAAEVPFLVESGAVMASS